jgi:hypothetical protein
MALSLPVSTTTTFDARDLPSPPLKNTQNNSESVINHIFEDSLPTEVSALPRTLSKYVLKVLLLFFDAVRAEFFKSKRAQRPKAAVCLYCACSLFECKQASAFEEAASSSFSTRPALKQESYDNGQFSMYDDDGLNDFPRLPKSFSKKPYVDVVGH